MDYGEDIMHRYDGYSKMAATSLYVMLDGFPEPPEGRLTKEYRNKCLAFLSSDANIVFKKEIDWRGNNRSISRIRFLLFGL